MDTDDAGRDVFFEFMREQIHQEVETTDKREALKWRERLKGMIGRSKEKQADAGRAIQSRNMIEGYEDGYLLNIKRSDDTWYIMGYSRGVKARMHRAKLHK